MKKNINNTLSDINYLRLAVDTKQFSIEFQPKVNVKIGQVVGLESLVRWNHPTKGYLNPDQFIPLAEETGLIIDIDNFVLKHSCQYLKELNQKDFRDLSISVNVSTLHFQTSNLIKTIEKVTKEAGINPSKLILEITETSIMKNFERAYDQLIALKNMGVKIALDDFGTGYSSMNYLKLLPLDIIKLDRSFISDIITNKKDKAIVKGIISLAKNLKLEVFAEGIETNEQAQLLSKLKCKVMQGFYYAKPMQPSQLELYLSRNQINGSRCQEVY